MRTALRPIDLKPSIYGVSPETVKDRCADLAGITSVLLSELFPGLPTALDIREESAVRQRTVEALSNVDFGMIKPGDSVNIIASHHGFTVEGGAPYATMIKTLKDVVAERTGCTNIRLRAGVGMRFRETEEYIQRFGLDDYFGGKAIGVCPVDEGIAIETEIGTLYGLKKVYDADWIIQAHNSDVREVHFHRQVDRAVKCFAMSFARNETRSTYHHNVGPRVANFVARAIFESPFVQSKWCCGVFLMVSPNGIVGVDADNNLLDLNERVMVSGLETYGKVITLLSKISEMIVLLDFPCPVAYVRGAGVIFANFLSLNMDMFDLDNPLPSYTWYTEAFYGEDGKPLIPEIPPVHPGIKAIVHNYAWGGYPHSFFAEHVPTIVVGVDQARFMDRDPLNPNYMRYATIADSLDTAVYFAQLIGKTDNIFVFDGAPGGVNVSAPLREELLGLAPEVNRLVEEELMPKWLKQRGIDPMALTTR